MGHDEPTVHNIRDKRWRAQDAPLLCNISEGYEKFTWLDSLVLPNGPRIGPSLVKLQAAAWDNRPQAEQTRSGFIEKLTLVGYTFLKANQFAERLRLPLTGRIRSP